MTWLQMLVLLRLRASARRLAQGYLPGWGTVWLARLAFHYRAQLSPRNNTVVASLLAAHIVRFFEKRRALATTPTTIAGPLREALAVIHGSWVRFTLRLHTAFRDDDRLCELLSVPKIRLNNLYEAAFLIAQARPNGASHVRDVFVRRRDSLTARTASEFVAVFGLSPLLEHPRDSVRAAMYRRTTARDIPALLAALELEVIPRRQNDFHRDDARTELLNALLRLADQSISSTAFGERRGSSADAIVVKLVAWLTDDVQQKLTVPFDWLRRFQIVVCSLHSVKQISDARVMYVALCIVGTPGLAFAIGKHWIAPVLESFTYHRAWVALTTALLMSPELASAIPLLYSRLKPSAPVSRVLQNEMLVSKGLREATGQK